MLRALALLPLLAAAAPPSAPNVGGVGQDCLSDQIQSTDTQGEGRLRRLDTLPPATEVLTVLRYSNGCMKQVVVRTGIEGSRSGPKR